MKRWGILLMVMLLSIALVFTGCGNNNDDAQQQQQEQQNQQQGEQNDQNAQNGQDGAGEDAQNVQAQVEVKTLTGEFQGLADGHSAELIVNDEAAVFQFYDEAVAAQLESMEAGATIQFDVETDAETGAQTITKVYETQKTEG